MNIDPKDPLSVIELCDRANDLKVKDFTEILQRIDTLDEKKRALWTEIYENCISDRQNAYALFIKLITICESKSTEWSIHGRTIVSLQERMSRSVDQLLKLAELVMKAERSANEINVDDVYNAIGK